MSNIDEDALIALIDRDAPVTRSVAEYRFGPGDMVDLPSGSAASWAMRW